MRPVILSIVALLTSAALLQLGNGLQFTLLPVRADMARFSDLEIAFIGSAYFAGFLAGTLIGPALIGAVGHIRVLAGVLAGISASVLVFPLGDAPAVWFAARCLIGVGLAMAYMAIESWLNERSGPGMRGALLSLYSLIGMVALAAGQALMVLYPVDGFELFTLAAICAALAALPVALTRAPAPAQMPQPRLSLHSLLAVSQVSVVGSLVVGLSNSAFWAFGPVYVHRLGFGGGGIGAFMAAALAGGAMMMWPVGALSDRVDRRIVAGIVSAGAGLAALGLVLFGGENLGLTLTLSWLFGACGFTLYPVCIAHANDHVPAHDFVQVSGGILFLFGAGSLFGPPIVALLMEPLGEKALYSFIAVAHGFGALAIFILRRLRPASPSDEKHSFQPVPRTTPAAYQLFSEGDSGNKQP